MVLLHEATLGIPKIPKQVWCPRYTHADREPLAVKPPPLVNPKYPANLHFLYPAGDFANILRRRATSDKPQAKYLLYHRPACRLTNQ